MKKYKIIDLFAGVGGLSRGFQRTGRFDLVFALDNDKACKRTFDISEESIEMTLGDIKCFDYKKEIPKFDILVAGFPCQSFSIAGYREGFQDKKGRGDLFFYLADIINHFKPSAFLLENVKNLKNHDDGKTFRIIAETLNKIGYDFKAEILNSMEYGSVPQNRERIYIVGFLKHSYSIDNFKFPLKKVLTKTFKSVLQKKVEENYFYKESKITNELRKHVIDPNTVYQWRRVYVRANKKGVCPTLTANMGTGGHNVPIVLDKTGVRKLTPRECARLQGFKDSELRFPKDQPNSQLYKQIGNSVTVNVVSRIALNMLKVLDN